VLINNFVFCYQGLANSHDSDDKLQDKILQSTGRGREVTVTNDGATIFKSLHIDNPAAKVLVGILIIFYYCGDIGLEIIGWYGTGDLGKT
jgi:hypothetical protein